jgi:hypothetical protein
MQLGWLLFFLGLCSAGAAVPTWAQESRKTFPGEKTDAVSAVDLRVDKWKGNTFVFLEKERHLQKWGYRLSLRKERVPSKRDYDPKLEVPVSKNLRYDRFVGKTISCLEAEKIQGEFDYAVTFLDPGENLKLFGFTYQGHLDGIAFAADLPRSQARWKGKTIYALERHLPGLQPDSDRPQKITVSIGEPLTVLDVGWGTDALRPLKVLVARKDGRKGFFSAGFSWTNVFAGWWRETRPWEDVFSETDPREKFKWGEETWKAVDEGTVTRGMTKEQARLSWGKAEKITTERSAGGLRELWFYESKVLIFEGEKVAAIQTRGAK